MAHFRHHWHTAGLLSFSGGCAGTQEKSSGPPIPANAGICMKMQQVPTRCQWGRAFLISARSLPLRQSRSTSSTPADFRPLPALAFRRTLGGTLPGQVLRSLNAWKPGPEDKPVLMSKSNHVLIFTHTSDLCILRQRLMKSQRVLYATGSFYRHCRRPQPRQ